MGRESSRDVDDGPGRPPRRRHHRGEAHDWDMAPDAVSHSLPRRRTTQVQRSASRTSRTKPGRASDAPESTMPPPRLARASTDGYRRPRSVIYSDEDAPVRRHSRRDHTPAYESRRRSRRVEYSASSESPASRDSASDTSEEETGDDDKETIDEADDEAPRERRLLTDGNMESDDRRRHRRRHRRRSSDDEDQRRHSASDLDSPVPRPRVHVEQERKSHRHQMTDVINSRPPVSSKRPSKRAAAPQTTDLVYHDSRPRRSHTVGSRSSNRSSSRRPASILGSIFSAGPSARRTSPEKPAKLAECIVCMDDLPPNKVAKLKCGHRMCHTCLKRNFRLSVDDPQHMPPKCCTADYIPLKHVERLFSTSFKMTWNRKFSEYSTRNRIYCPARNCGEWIKPANIRRENGRKVARCERCRIKVCGKCNGKWHSSPDCPKDEETNRFLEQAKEAGWQRCHKCKVMVELKEGCNHMTCRCGAEFCMICGTKWKGCDCPWFNYDNPFDPDVPEMNLPVPGIRGELDDIFNGDGPPVPAELRMARGPEQMRMRPQGYEEEMHMRRLQEQQDQDLARHMQLYGNMEEDDGYQPHGDITGIGNASGHHMNDDYRRGSRHRRPPPGPSFDRGPDYVRDVGRARRRDASLEQRLADRLSENRHSMGRPGLVSPHQIPPLMGNPMATPNGLGMMAPVPPPVPMPIPAPMHEQMPMMRRHTGEDEMYSNTGSARSERVAGSRASRHYDEDLHPPRRRQTEGPPGSAMAGLNGKVAGSGRVSEWRSFVQPGAPEEEWTNTAGSR